MGRWAGGNSGRPPAISRRPCSWRRNGRMCDRRPSCSSRYAQRSGFSLQILAGWTALPRGDLLADGPAVLRSGRCRSPAPKGSQDAGAEKILVFRPDGSSRDGNDRFDGQQGRRQPKHLVADHRSMAVAPSNARRSLPMKWVDRQRRGFTLMEAVVALAVFTVGMLGLGGAFSQIVAGQRGLTAKADRRPAGRTQTGPVPDGRCRGVDANERDVRGPV